MKTIRLSGWGRFPTAMCRVLQARGGEEVAAIVAAAKTDGLRTVARGNGRSYGDASLQPQGTLCMLGSDRVIAFDEATGLLTCEAGLLLADLIDIFLPRGWFPPVTPGTKLVTIGGMIAADAHGKNHHKVGGFGRHVESLTLVMADGRTLTCSRTENAELFAATCGGMGLTGVIVTATFRLLRVQSRYMTQHTQAAANLDAAMDLFEANQNATYSVAWIDCLASGDSLGRSLFYTGEHATLSDLDDEQRAAPFATTKSHGKTIPVDFPSFALNRWTVRAFNAFYYRLPRLLRRLSNRWPRTIIDIDPFFYPLDALHDWNRIYGKRGFVQYQCVLPMATSREGIRQLLQAISTSGMGSFLAVLKLLGPGDFPLSFPMEGYTLALDFPVGRRTFDLLNKLDAITAAHGGRIYLAKDARASASSIAATYPAIDQFKAARNAADPAHQFSSLLSERLDL